ncbi:MAG: helix-turn-helix transcriptional regulator [Firmicutes bacterium]|nr:helix-turn-helix transcriptional regulator [Bacillota bacterium]
MNAIYSIVEMREYGRVSIHVREVMERKGITRNKLSVLTGTRFEVIDRFYKGKVERIDADVLARICFALGCQAGDIVKYEKN